MSRLVVVLFGPPAAGKSTTAALSGMPVVDRDVLGSDVYRERVAAARAPGARLVIVATGATRADRAQLVTAADATHAYVLPTPPRVCHHRAKLRGDGVGIHAGITKWWRLYDRGPDAMVWPGAWSDVDGFALPTTSRSW